VSKVRIQLRRNAETGKQDLIVDLQSDVDVMQFEHERVHAQIVDHLVRHGWDVDMLGPLVVERVRHQETERGIGESMISDGETDVINDIDENCTENESS
jgi:hypothetical protein